MNKRIKKKHMWLGSKRAGANYCATEILRHIIRKCKAVSIEPNIRNIERYIRWFYHNSSEDEWVKRVADAYMPWQMILSAKHLLKYVPEKKDVVENSLSVKVAKQLKLDDTTIDRISKLLTSEGGDNISLNPQYKVWVDSSELDKLIKNIDQTSRINDLVAELIMYKKEMFKHHSDSEEYKAVKKKVDELKKEINRLYGENDDMLINFKENENGQL